MKKKTLLTSAAVAAAGIAAFFVGKKLMNRNKHTIDEPGGKKRHTTNTFSRAKQQTQGSPDIS